MAEIDEPKSPPHPKRGTRDDSVGTLFKLAGGYCAAICGCIFGPLLFFMSLSFAPYGFGFLVIISLVCMALGCISAKYTWDGMHRASGYN